MGNARMRKLIYLLIFILICNSCYSAKHDDKSKSNSNQATYNKGKRDMDRYLYNVILGLRQDLVQEAISKGADPNYCWGEFGWKESNPLDVVGWYSTYPYYGLERDTSYPTPEVAIVDCLVKNGADINRRPYIWRVVFQSDNDILAEKKRQRKANNEPLDYNSAKMEESQFVDDVNRLLKVFLDHGANPDKLGHPYPYSNEAIDAQINDRQANEYFSKGTRAINIAIGKGIIWESQVDLLLKYTILDVESLKAAERSKDVEMIKKINIIWERQQADGIFYTNR
jgi:hypothetical protein